MGSGRGGAAGDPSARRNWGANLFKAYGRYFDFRGRSGRSEFWLVTLWNILCVIAAVAIDMLIFGGDPTSPFGIYGPAYLLVVLANLIPGLAVDFRRLHDSNRSAWWILISLAPLIGSIALIVFWCQGSTPGPNRFGAQPGAPLDDLQTTFA